MAPLSQEPARPAASRRFLVVGIGASAGGLEALQELLNHMPDEMGMAFVIITHQHPGHTSALPELLSQCTTMPVLQAMDGTKVEPDHVYVSPPGQPVAIKDGALYLVDAPSEERPRLPIDQFFRSLATDQQDRALCIVLSGTGSDGTLGLKAIKGESGTALVQSLETARYGGMPSNAIATAQADFVLPPKAMPEHLLACARTRVGQSRWRSAPRPPQTPPEPRIQKILLALQARTGNDFSRYKSGTLHRRIERRMAVHRIKEWGDYVHLVQQHPQEVDRLFRDLLIGVTSFFRDPEAFEVLRRRVLSRRLAGYPDRRAFRVWTPGCSTGEEAYTIAILLRELMRELNVTVEVQLFATDLDAEAIDAARTGRYPLGIAADVPRDLLRRYFVQDGSAYTVRPELREMIVFAQQNLIKDPPFVRLDFISCRNVLIYLQADLQRRLLASFHHALRPHGCLMLGPSETVDSLGEQFQTVDKKWKLFRRRQMPTMPDQPELPTPPSPPRPPPARPTDQPSEPKRPSPVTALIEQLLAMAREGLQTELAHALRWARGQPREIVRSGVRVKTNGGHAEVDVSATRLTEPKMLNRTEVATVILGFELTVHPPKRGERIFRLNARQLGQESGLAGRILLTLEDASKT